MIGTIWKGERMKEHIMEVPAPMVVEFWCPDEKIENHLVCTGFCHSVEDNIRYVNLLEEVERPDKRGLTAEAFEDWESERIDFTKGWDGIKWYTAFVGRRVWLRDIKDKDEYQQIWKKMLVSVRFSPYPIKYPI